MLIDKRESTSLKHLTGFKAFIEYSYDMDDIHENIEEYNPNKEQKILTVFDNMSSTKVNNETRKSIVIKLLIRGRKLSTSFFLSHNLSFVVPKKYKTKFYIIFHHGISYLIIEISNKQELQQIALLNCMQSLLFACCSLLFARGSPRFLSVTPAAEGFYSDLLQAVISYWVDSHLESC